MTEGQITILIAAITWIFSAGGLVMWIRMSIAELKKEHAALRDAAERDVKLARSDLYRDINGIGNRVRQNEDAAGRRYHNVSMSLLIAAPQTKESELSALLREGT